MHNIKSKTADILHSNNNNSKIGLIINISLVALIIISVLVIILESIQPLQNKYGHIFFFIEAFSVIIFTIEYLLRLWSCTGVDKKHNSNFKARIYYMITPMAIIDLLAILPFYLAAFLPMDLLFLRIVRLLRVLKLTRYSQEIKIIFDVLKKEKGAFVSIFFMVLIIIVVISGAIYIIEKDVQPEVYGSIPDAMWWAIVTLTTVGFGDATPITPLGKLLGAFVTITGVLVIALPAGILASGFAEQLKHRKEIYLEQLELALEDGVIDEKEENELKSLRKELNLEEFGNHSKRKRMNKIRARKVCPHCHKEL